MWSSDPKAFGETVLRPNDMSNTLKGEYGYIADNSYINASDPNSILDKPGVPRSFQAYKLSNGKITRSQKFGQQYNGVPHPLAHYGQLNNSFYAFGAQHTNIRDHLDATNTNLWEAGDNASPAKNTLLPSEFPVAKDQFYVSKLNQTFDEIKGSILNEEEPNLIKGPNAVMNDYTKNISQSIFTPGVYKVDGRIETLQQKFAERRGYDPHGQDTIPRGTYKNLMIRDDEGMRATVTGRLGEKYVTRANPAAKTRVRSAAPTQSRNVRFIKSTQNGGKTIEPDQGSTVSGMKVFYD